MYRAFVSTWSGVAGGHITTPIQDFIGDSDLGMRLILRMYWPDKDGNGLPDRGLVLTVAWQPDGATTPQGQTIEDFGNLAGVYMLPAYRFAKPVSEIPQAVKEDILTKLENRGIPRSTFSGVEVYGDFLRKVAKYFQVNFADFDSTLKVGF